LWDFLPHGFGSEGSSRRPKAAPQVYIVAREAFLEKAETAEGSSNDVPVTMETTVAQFHERFS